MLSGVLFHRSMSPPHSGSLGADLLAVELDDALIDPRHLALPGLSI
jgi:hypothetical protein